MSTGPSLYNPRDTRPEQLDALLTGRTPLLEEILANLREQAQGATRQHWLLRGQRGMGKTHLAGVIHYRVRTDPTLNTTYLPLWMGEADAYEIYSSATLLKTIGERLSEETKDAALRARLNAVEGIGDAEGYFHELTEFLTAEAERRGRVFLVLMENLDALLGSFDRKERKEQTRQFRSLLLHNARFLFISTTPTYYLNSPLDDPKEPLYAHLKERDLDHLTEAESEQLLRKLSQTHPRPGADTFLDGEEGRLRLRVIHRLTGGLPRSIVMAFTAIREAAGLGSLVQELRALLDSQTAYFESRLSQLPARERAIVTTLALAPTNLTMKEIAALSRLPERTLSTLMSRLEKDGHLRPAERSGGKGAVYELSEGLFRLWYQYRKGRPVLEPLVEFLAYWYHAEELERVVTALRESADSKDTSLTSELALLQAEEAFRRANSQEGRQERERLWTECQQALRQEQIAAEVLEWAAPTKARMAEAIHLLNEGDGKQAGRELIEQMLQAPPFTNEHLLPALLRMTLEVVTEQATVESFRGVSKTLSLILKTLKSNNRSTNGLISTKDHALLALALIDENPQQSLTEAGFALNKVDPSDHTTLFIAQAASGIALYNSGKHSESVEPLEGALKTHSISTPNQLPRELLLIILTQLLDHYESSKQTKNTRRIRKQLVEHFGSHKEDPFRGQAALARARLASGTKKSQSISILESWLADYDHLDGFPYGVLRGAVAITLALLRSIEGEPSAHKYISDWVDSVSRGRISDIQPVFHFSHTLFHVFGPEMMKQWLVKLAMAQHPEELQLLISWHLMAAEVLIEQENDAKTGTRTRRSSKSAWARIPPELRPNIEDLVKEVRKLRAK